MAYSGKHIFFDLDRTLWDFNKNSERALRILFEECGLAQHIPSFESFQKVYYNKNKALWHAYSIGKISKESLRYERFRSTLKKFQLTDESLIKRFGDGYVDLSPKQTALVPFAVEVISDLKQMGFTLHIITNGFQEIQGNKLKNSNILHYFDTITNSEMAGVKKPHPNIFEFALSLANASKEESIMIGDSLEADVEGALTFGIDAVYFNEHNENVQDKIHQVNHLLELKNIL